MSRDLEYKSIPFALKQTDTDEKYFYFKGHAAVFNVIDRGGDRILPGAFNDSLGRVPVKILWQHHMSEPLGVPVEMREDSKGLFVHGKMPKDDSLVKGRVIPQMRVGSVDTLSIGYSIVEYNTEKSEDENTIWNLTKLDLYEVSPVSIPMHPDAKITDLKAVTRFKNLPLADRNRKWSKKEAIPRIREHTGSTEKPSRTYRNYFMWFDAENSDNFTAYKLPYADWIDGQFKAVPRALIAIKAAVGGARGGVNIPEADKSKILRHVERYLSQLKDGEKIFMFEDVKDISDRESLNKFLKETGLLTKAGREHLASLAPGRRKSDSLESEIVTIHTESMAEIKQLLKGAICL